MPRLSLVSLTCALALVTAGCDRQSEQAAQPEAATGTGEELLTGKIDRAFAGEAIPAIELTNPEGAKLSLTSLKGKPALVNLWATWCVPCVSEMPLLDDLAGELGDSVAVITISEDQNGAAAVEPFYAQRKFANLPKWLDPEMELPVAYSAAGLPLTVLYDAEGKEVWRVMGGFDWSSAEAREMIAEAGRT